MKRRIAALFMAAIVAAGALAGCGGSGGNDAGTGSGGNQGSVESDGGNAGGDNGDATTIIVEMINYGFDDADLQMVEDAMNEITVPEIGVRVDFLTVPIGEMATKLGLMVSGGEDIDLVCAGLLTSPVTLVNEGLLQPITEYINNSPVLSEKAGELLEACTVNGEIYAYPGALYAGSGGALFYDKDMAEEYNIQMPDHVSSGAELTAILEQAAQSGMPCYAISMGDGVNAERNFGISYEGLGDSVNASYGVIVDAVNGTEVVNWYETEEYQDQVKRHREWFQAGYSVPDSISNGYVTYDSMAQGQCFSFVGTYSSGTTEAYFGSMTGKNVGRVVIGEPLVDTTGIINTCWGVASTSTKAAEVVKFVELLYTNEELATLYRYGIEGTHFVRTEGSRVITYPEGKDSMSVGYGAFIPMFGDESELPVMAPLTEDYYSTLDSFSIEHARVSKYLGYSFDPSSVDSKVRAVQSVVAQYGPSLNVGSDDFDTLYPQFIQALKDAGIDDIIAENQAQLDAWLAEQ